MTVAGLTDLDVFDVPRNLGGRRGRYATLEDRILAIDDRHVGQRQLEDDRKKRRTEPTHHLDVFVGDLLGCGRRDGEPLDMGQHTGRCCLHLLHHLESGILKFLSAT